jgi:Sec7-like guanine-nucleotide exchange factor
MEAFAKRYYSTGGRDVFRSQDGAFILAFSLIMLNTDAHNPSIKKKMSKEAFVQNNRGIDGGNDVPKDFLERCYDEIVRQEIKMKHEGALSGKQLDQHVWRMTTEYHACWERLLTDDRYPRTQEEHSEAASSNEHARFFDYVYTNEDRYVGYWVNGKVGGIEWNGWNEWNGH